LVVVRKKEKEEVMNGRTKKRPKGVDGM